MKTTEKTIRRGNLTGLSFFLASSLVNQLQASNSLIDGFKKSVEGDGIISVYIIGGILVFGIFGYFIVTRGLTIQVTRTAEDLELDLERRE